ncbi:MAG: DegT/DnrJ/EryC1/StrS family aminotransferase [Anaerolineales bacterium]|jgi:perosamine synthetase|nr:DegT/DnrJ/EryC1/StrS family aminotransferase [Anaerolineales bacterium]
MINISRPQIGEDEKKAVLDVLDSGHLAQGPRVQAFEEAFAKWTDTKYAVATSSGTTALHVALLAQGIGPEDEVITTPFSFIASANSILYTGARPVFVDIESDYFMIDPEKLEKAITPKTKAIIPVHLFGQIGAMDEIERIARKHNLVIIEDACQSHGAKYKGKKVGAWGTACYSFYPTKNMTTIEGGMITTNDPQVAERARLIRNHGSPKRYLHDTLGFNFRMTDIQAAIGLVQLSKVDEWNRKRQENARFLTERFSKINGVKPPMVREGCEHVFHQYTICVDKGRDKLVEGLNGAGIAAGVYYPIPIHQQPLYTNMGYQDVMPVTEALALQVMSLPVHPTLTQGELDTIVREVGLRC